MTQAISHSQNLRKQAIAQHFASAFNYDHHATIQREICEQLIEQILEAEQFKILEIGAGTGQLTKLLADQVRNKTITCQDIMINELADCQFNALQNIFPKAKIMIGDAENLAFGQHFSLIISANAIQWFDEPLSLVDKAFFSLNSGGQLLFNTFSPKHFLQIKALTGQGLNYPTKDAWQERLIQAGFTQIQITTKRFDLSFADPMAVLKHMKLTGVSTNCPQKAFVWTKAKLSKFIKQYQAQFFNPNKPSEVILTYDALIISAIKP